MINIPKNVTLNKLRPWRAHAITLLLLATALALAAWPGRRRRGIRDDFR